MNRSKVKGANGEREAAAVLMEWLAPVYEGAGVEQPKLTRNLEQTRGGGYDLVGLDWLALEVKRREQVALPAWWKQTVGQAGEGQIPFLMWRVNRGQWKFRVLITIGHWYGRAEDYVVDMDLEQARRWLQMECWQRLTIKEENE